MFHTLTTYQFAKPERQALDDMLVLVSLRRPLFRLSLEFSGGVYPLTLTRYADGAKEARLLALCDPQGGEMEWRDEKSPPSCGAQGFAPLLSGLLCYSPANIRKSFGGS